MDVGKVGGEHLTPAPPDSRLRTDDWKGKALLRARSSVRLKFNMDIREMLFDKFYNNLCMVKSHSKIRLDPDIPNSIFCPQCLLVIERAHLADKEILTPEHVPPEALGGSIETFTCKKCNSWSGHYLESHLVHSLDMANFVEGVPGSAVDGIVKFSDDLFVTAELTYIDEGYLYIRADQSRSIPGSVEKSFETLHANQPEINLRTSGKRGKVIRPRRSEAALLRIAYLTLFSKFGYAFLLYPGAKIVRSQFKHPGEDILPDWGIFSDPFIQGQEPGIYIITKPPDLRSFMVIIELSQETKSRKYAVLIPGPTMPHFEIYEYIINKKNVNELIEFSAQKLDLSKDILLDQNMAFEFFDVWNAFLESNGSP